MNPHHVTDHVIRSSSLSNTSIRFQQCLLTTGHEYQGCLCGVLGLLFAFFLQIHKIIVSHDQ